MASRWGLAHAAGYAPLPAGEEPADSLPPALAARPGHPHQQHNIAQHQHHHQQHQQQQHTSVHVRSDREAAVAQYLLAAAHQDAPALLAELGTSTEGLSEGEAAARLARHGPNVIATAGAAPWFR